MSHDFQNCYDYLGSLGRRWRDIGGRLLVLVRLRVLKVQPRVLLAVDDSPTKRFGPKVQRAGVHHDPTPGPTGSASCYGHVWVTLPLAVRHPPWGALALPLRALLYVRRRTLPSIPRRRGWMFRTKLELAAKLLHWAGPFPKRQDRHPGRSVTVILPRRLASLARPDIESASS
jgi:hypothetical protein